MLACLPPPPPPPLFDEEEEEEEVDSVRGERVIFPNRRELLNIEPHFCSKSQRRLP
jgi:hypothetical protein